jgi:hypothetical protein
MGHFCGQKVAPLVVGFYSSWKLFVFSRKPIFFGFTTLIQLPMAGLKIKLSNFFDMVPQPPALNGFKKHLLGHISSF